MLPRHASRQFSKQVRSAATPLSPFSNTHMSTAAAGPAVPVASSRLAAKLAFLLLAWYASSSIAIFFTKGLLSPDNGRLPDFAFALTITATNNVVAYLCAAALSDAAPAANHDRNVRRISVLIGATTAAEIGLCNIALSFFSVSFATILKGTSPFFVMLWGAAFGLVALRPPLLASMLAIVCGVALAVAGESTPANALSASAGSGLVAQLASGVLSGLRWVLTQVFLKGDTGANSRIQQALDIQPLSRGLSTVETVRMTAPFTCLPLLPLIVLAEGRGLLAWAAGAAASDVGAVVGTLACVGLSVFCLLLAEYELVKVTSSLTVSVAFVVKEVLVIAADRVLFSQRLDPLTWAGFGVVQAGVLGYALSKRAVGAQCGAAQDGSGAGAATVEKDVP